MKMLFFKLIICFQFALYILFGVLLYIPLQLKAIKMEIINQLLTWHGTNEMWLQSESVTTNNFLIAGDNNNDSINDEDLAINNPTVIRCSTNDCGICENETAERGIIASSNFPNSYDSNCTCTYTIRTEEHRKIELRFDEFFVEYQYDWIYVFNQENATVADIMSTLHASLTGYTKPNIITSQFNVMTLIFVTDSDNTEVTPAGLVCRWKASFLIV